MNGPWFVWTGSVRAQGVFPSCESALAHCRVLTNDHRRKYEFLEVCYGAYRYVGPRGRRHGTRLVAFVCTRDGGAALGLNLRAVFGAAAEARS